MFIPVFKKHINKKKLNQKFKSKKKNSFSLKLIRCTSAIISQAYSLITFNQLEMIRRFLARNFFKKNKKFVRLSLTHTLFKKASKSRMGKGLGKFYKWYAFVKPGQIIFEFNMYSDLFKKKLLTLSKKLPFNVKILFKNIIFFKNFVLSQ